MARRGGRYRFVVAGVLAATVCTAGVAPAAGASDPGGPTATAAALRDELGRRGERLAKRPGTGVLAFAAGTVDRPLQAGGAGGPEAAARRFVDRYAAAFGATAGSDLVTGDVERTPAGDGVRFQQHHRGVPVIGGQMSVQLDRDGAVLSATGRVAPSLKLDVTPAVTADEAAATAVARTAKADRVDAADLSAAPPELGVFDPALWGITDREGPRLVWSTDVRTPLGSINRHVLVDALDGRVALDFDQVHAGRQRLVCDQGNVPQDPPPCPGTLVRSEGQGATGDAEIDNAYDFAGVTYDFYLNVLGRDSLDGAGLPLRSTVRVCLALNSGEPCPWGNAYWDGQLNQMFYGQGFTTADDVVAHELTHGVTDFTSNLFYYAQSGAINESLSDVFGELVDRSTPDGDPAWLQGEDLPGGALRDMANPPAGSNPDPDRMRSPNYWLDSGDSAGVHINSGVNNKAAFLITSGGTFNGQTVTGIGDIKAAHVYYLAQTTMLTSLSQYSDLAVMLPQACRNLIGQHGIAEADCQQVDKAVLATEMALPPNDLALTAPAACASGAMVRNATAALDSQADPSAWAYTTNVPGLTPSFETGATIGNPVVYVPDNNSPADVAAVRATPITVPAGPAFLTVRHLYGLEDGFDGGVVEFSVNGTTWSDLQATVGGPNVVNGYDNSTQGSGNPLGSRAVFGGESFGFVTTRYDVSALAGQTIRLRFRVGSDASVFTLGWLIDDIALYTCGAALPPAAPVATLSGKDVSLTWSAPSSTVAISGYRIVPLRGGVPQAPIVVGPVGAHTITGLPGGVYNFTVAAITGVGAEPASPPSNTVAIAQPFAPLTPARLLETRPGLSTADGLFNGIGLLGPGTVTAVTVAGRAGVPSDASAVALNVTVTDARGPGFVTVFPCGVASVPNASNLNFDTGATVPNMVVAKVGAGGQVCVFTPTATHLLIDVNGFFPAATAFTPIVPARVLETRSGLATIDGALNGIGLRGGGTVTVVPIAGRAGVPLDASAVVLNVTVTGTQAPGFATVYPCGGNVPTASNLNHGVGATVPNATVTKIGANGAVCIFTLAPTHLLVDVNGWFPPGADVTPLVPARLLETRPGLVTSDGLFNALGVRQPGVVTALQVTGRSGVPNGATAVALNVTVTETQAPGFVTVFPCEGSPPTASNLNFGVGTTVANAVLAKVGPGGQVCFYSLAAHHLVVDVNGFVTG